MKFRLEIVVINEAFTKSERDGVTEAYTHALVQTQKWRDLYANSLVVFNLDPT